MQQEYLSAGRKDGRRVRGLDPLHTFMPYIYPNRADSEAYMREQIDLTKLLAWLEEKNAGNPEYPCTLFHVVLAAMHRALVLRPRMNRFIAGRRVYQREKVSLAFIAKKKFCDDGAEALLFLTFENDATIDTIRERIWKEITRARQSDTVDATTSFMGTLDKLPRFLLRFFTRILFALDFRGRVPQSLIATDPNYASVFLSNLGSIGLDAVYHHLSNWGTNSIFVVTGKRYRTPLCMDDGSIQAREVFDLGITLDERIADGYYYASTIRLLKELLQNPALLEQPAVPPEQAEREAAV